jgi:hypothetical protein
MEGCDAGCGDEDCCAPAVRTDRVSNIRRADARKLMSCLALLAESRSFCKRGDLTAIDGDDGVL